MPTTYRFKTQAAETQFRFVAAAVLPIELEFEAPRNVSAGAGNVLTGAHEHIAGAQIDGTLTLPAAGEVTNQADDFGNPGSPVGPTRVDPDEGDVLAGSGNYGDPGAPFVPGYLPDFPDAANVLTNDTTDGDAGTAKIRATVDVKIKAV